MPIRYYRHHNNFIILSIYVYICAWDYIDKGNFIKCELLDNLLWHSVYWSISRCIIDVCCKHEPGHPARSMDQHPANVLAILSDDHIMQIKAVVRLAIIGAIHNTTLFYEHNSRDRAVPNVALVFITHSWLRYAYNAAIRCVITLIHAPFTSKKKKGKLIADHWISSVWHLLLRLNSFTEKFALKLNSFLSSFD